MNPDAIAVVTGANSGFGKVVARDLAKSGALVIMACRSTHRGDGAKREIIGQIPRGRLEVRSLDLSSQSDVRRFASELTHDFDRLDVLVNNAAMTANRRTMSVDGVEQVFATNVLGPFLLTELLLPRLRASAPSRIVNVASAFAGDLDLDDLQVERRRYTNTRAYRQSKACNRLWTWELARRLEGSGVAANAVHPGMVTTTGLYRDVPAVVRAFLGLISRFYGNKSVEDGADTITWLASSPDVEGISGKFFSDRGPIPCDLADPDAERRLWAICESLIAPGDR